MNVLSRNKMNSQVLDKAGIICSIGCMVHCLLLPIFTFFIPVLSSFAENEIAHYSLLMAIIPIVIITFIHQFKNHRRYLPGAFAFLGLSLVLLALFFEEHHHHEEKINLLEHFLSKDKILTLIGSVFLIIAHTFNIKLTKRSPGE